MHFKLASRHFQYFIQASGQEVLIDQVWEIMYVVLTKQPRTTVLIGNSYFCQMQCASILGCVIHYATYTNISSAYKDSRTETVPTGLQVQQPTPRCRRE